MKWNTPFPFLCVSYDIKIYSSTPGLAGRNLNSFCSYAGALKKCLTPWERVLINPLQLQPVVDSELVFIGLIFQCFSVSWAIIDSRKIYILQDFEYPRSIWSRGAFCQNCVSLEQGQIGFPVQPAQGTSRNGTYKTACQWVLTSSNQHC